MGSLILYIDADKQPDARTTILLWPLASPWHHLFSTICKVSAAKLLNDDDEIKNRSKDNSAFHSSLFAFADDLTFQMEIEQCSLPEDISANWLSELLGLVFGTTTITQNVSSTQTSILQNRISCHRHSNNRFKKLCNGSAINSIYPVRFYIIVQDDERDIFTNITCIVGWYLTFENGGRMLVPDWRRAQPSRFVNFVNVFFKLRYFPVVRLCEIFF